MAFKFSTVAVAASVLALASSPLTSHAAPLLFTLDESTSQVVTFVLDSNPQPLLANVFRDSFEVDVADATLNGQPDAALTQMTFADSSRDSGGMTSGDGAVVAAGDQVFTGSTANPYFAAGTFGLFDENNQFAPEILTVSALSAAPEPSTWALMIVGLGVMGLALRRRSPQNALG